MRRLHIEFDRLYAPAAALPDLVGADGQVRALVMDIGRPVDGAVVAQLWRAMQEDLAWPAAAMVIAGGPSFQLWWSLEAAVPAQDAARFLLAAQRRFLPELKEGRVQRFPAPAQDGDPANGAPGWIHAPRVPQAVTPEQWSAFVAPGLAPVFEETPWLDFPPNEEGQAELLQGLTSVSPEQWHDAWARLGLTSTPPGSEASAASAGSLDAKDSQNSEASQDSHALRDARLSTGSTTFTDPRAFLLQVMNDGAVPMALRIEAAKALLPQSSHPRA